MKVLLTGATGLLGNNVLETLLSAGHRVSLIVRNPDKLAAVRNSQFHKEGVSAESSYTIINGDITDISVLRSAAKGCDAIINCAGDTDMSHRHLEDYFPINRDLCTALLNVASSENITTLVHISTANTIGFGSPTLLADELTPMQPPFTKSYYAISKLAGETMLLTPKQTDDSSMCPHPATRVVIIHPGYIIGKYDMGPSSGKLLLMGWRKRIMIVPPGGKSFVSARTVAQAAVAALSHGNNAEHYLATGENLTFRQLFLTAASVGGYKQYIFELPRFVCRFAGVVGDLLEKCNLSVSFTSRNINQLLVYEYYSNRKMIHDLGVEPQPIADAIKDFMDFSLITRH